MIRPIARKPTERWWGLTLLPRDLHYRCCVEGRGSDPPYCQETYRKVAGGGGQLTLLPRDLHESVLQRGEAVIHLCAAKAFYSCPAIISQRLESQKIPKEPQENTEEESKII